MNLIKNKTIPIFDSIYDLDTHLEFYSAMGFKVTYYQKSPYRYASVESSFTNIDFFANKEHDKEKGGGCYIVVPNVKEIYDDVIASLKESYGKIPSKDLPRVSKLNKTAEDNRFLINDPSGNTLIIGTPFGDSTELMDQEERRLKYSTKKEKAYSQAYRFAYSKEDFVAAKYLLEANFAEQDEDIPDTLYFKAKVLEADILLSLGNNEKVMELVEVLQSFSFIIEDKDAISSEAERLNEIEEEIALKIDS